MIKQMRKSIRATLTLVLLLYSLTGLHPDAMGFSLFEESELSAFGSRNDANNTAVVAHSSWNGLLAKYITEKQGLHYFAYGQVSMRDVKTLNAYIETLESVQITTLARHEQFAFWVNLYNALTVKVMLDHYPVDSIKDISFACDLVFFNKNSAPCSLFSSGPWSEHLTTVEGRNLSLDDIEHQILRPVFKDPRIHYVVNCASIGCPNLPLSAVVSADLEAQLDQAAAQYINHPRAVQVVAGKLRLSKIYKWYFSDFADSEAELIAHLKSFAEADLFAALETVTGVSAYHYDWSLNELPAELPAE